VSLSANLTKQASSLIKQGVNDIDIHDLFPLVLVEILTANCTAMKFPPAHIQRMRDYYDHYLRGRKAFEGMITDKAFGTERRLSWPDRFVSNIPCFGSVAWARPCVTTHFVEFKGPEGNINEGGVSGWFNNTWIPMMFNHALPPDQTPAAMRLRPYPERYGVHPSIAAGGIPLQLLFLAIYDAALLHACFQTMPETWHKAHAQAVTSIRSKDHKLIKVVQDLMECTDILGLQECSARHRAAFTRALPPHFEVVDSAASDQKRDQNSIIIFNKKRFEMCVDVTDKVEECLTPDVQLEGGDLLCLVLRNCTTNQLHFVVSFHDSVRTAAAVARAVYQLRIDTESDANIILAMDANTTTKAYAPFVNSLTHDCGFVSSWAGNSQFHQGTAGHCTTNNVRSALQPQGHKAFERNCHPKDLVMIERATMKVEDAVTEQNDDLAHAHWPNDLWPSDHAAVVVAVRECSGQ
jgi:hypothetical protein